VIQFFKELETELKLRGFSNKTIETYMLQNKRFIDFLNSSKTHAEYQKSLISRGDKRTPQDVQNSDLKAYLAFLLADKGLSPASVNLVISALKFFYVEVLNKPIFTNIKHPKPEKKLPVVLTKEEIKLMLDLTKNKRHKLLIELLYSTGLRVSEAVNIRIQDLQFDEKTAFVKYGKGKKERFVKLSNRFIVHAKSYLKRRKSQSQYLFSSRKGSLTTRQAERIVKNAALRANIQKKVFCHALRSTFATHMLDSGIDIRLIQELLGHANLATTQRYTKVSKARLLEVKSPLDKL
jgi:integrase/recombinase XerD